VRDGSPRRGRLFRRPVQFRPMPPTALLTFSVCPCEPKILAKTSADYQRMGTFWACRQLPFGADEQRTTKFQLLLSAFCLSFENRCPGGALLKCCLVNLVKTRALRKSFGHHLCSRRALSASSEHSKTARELVQSKKTVNRSSRRSQRKFKSVSILSSLCDLSDLLLALPRSRRVVPAPACRRAVAPPDRFSENRKNGEKRLINGQKTVSKRIKNRGKPYIRLPPEVVPFLVEKVGCLMVDCYPAFRLLSS